MSEDRFGGYSASVIEQATRWVTVAPSDTTDLAAIPKAIRVDVGGTIALTGWDGVVVTFAVTEGETLALRPVRVRATGTTATGIVAFY